MFSAASFASYAVSAKDSVYSVVGSSAQPQEDKNTPLEEVLDPLTISVQIALLRFKESGTLVRIYKNRIIYQEPSWYLSAKMQGMVRRIQGVSREDLNKLQPFVLKAADWYYQGKSNSSDGANDDFESSLQQEEEAKAEPIEEILKATILGYKALQVTYQAKDSNNTPAAIQNWISEIDGKFSKKSENVSLAPLTPLAKLVKQIWTEKDISYINSKLKEAEKELSTKDLGKASNLDNVIQTIETILLEKIGKLKEVQLKIATEL